jgi:hypothetical protein
MGAGYNFVSFVIFSVTVFIHPGTAYTDNILQHWIKTKVQVIPLTFEIF